MTLLGSKDELKWKQNEDALVVDFPATKPCEHAFVLKIETTK